MTDLSNVNRIEVIDGYGRSYTSFNADKVHIAIQDKGRTLKVFHTGDTSHGMRDDHSKSLGQAIADDQQALQDWIKEMQRRDG